MSEAEPCDHYFQDTKQCVKCGWLPPVTLERHDTPPRPGLYFARDATGWCSCMVTSIDDGVPRGHTAGMFGRHLPDAVEWLGPLEER